MTILEFIHTNKEGIDRVINNVNPGFDIDDQERELWLLNDEDLGNWAENEGVTL